MSPADQTGQSELLRRAEGIISQCDRCGACLPVCPLFGARDVESSSARGKNTLIRASALENEQFSIMVGNENFLIPLSPKIRDGFQRLLRQCPD